MTKRRLITLHLCMVFAYEFGEPKKYELPPAGSGLKNYEYTYFFSVPPHKKKNNHLSSRVAAAGGQR